MTMLCVCVCERVVRVCVTMLSVEELCVCDNVVRVCVCEKELCVCVTKFCV